MAYRIDKHPAQAFEAGCLYIVASLPRRLPYARHNLAKYSMSIPEDQDLGSYETDAATGRTVEEFEWSIYYHESLEGGTWYRLIKDLSQYHHGPCPNPQPPVYTLERIKIRGGTLRLQLDIVTIFAVLYLPENLAVPTFKTKRQAKQQSSPSAPETEVTPSDPIRSSPVAAPSLDDQQKLTFNMPLYLDWLTSRTAPRTNRTFIWAVSIFLRCRIHIANRIDTGDNIKTFDVKEFLREALAACYPEIFKACRPVLPRPVFLSGFSVHMLGGCDGGSSAIFAVDSVHLRLPHPEPEFETSQPPAARSSVAQSLAGCGESLYSEECRPDMFVWPTGWLGPKHVYACADAMEKLTTKKERCHRFALEPVSASQIKRSSSQITAAYNEEFPPLPLSLAKCGE